MEDKRKINDTPKDFSAPEVKEVLPAELEINGATYRRL